jgi:hypothetical protein
VIGRRKTHQAQTTPEVVRFAYPRIVRALRDSDAEEILSLLANSDALFAKANLRHSAIVAVGFATACAVQVLDPLPVSDQDLAVFTSYVYEAARKFPEVPPDDLTYSWLIRVTGGKAALQYLDPSDFTAMDLNALLSIAGGAVTRDQWNDGSIQKFFDMARHAYEQNPQK